MIRQLAVRAIRAPLRRLGYDVRHKDAIPCWERTAGLLAHYSLTPRTVFDIGVAEGTPWLYRAFPDADYHLIDPTRESLPHMQAIAQHLKATIHNVALGANDGEAEIAVRPEIGGSSLLTEVGKAAVSSRYVVPVRRFDGIMESAFARPALAKIDVQGAEDLVLRGMGDRLAELDVVIIETSLIATLENGPEFRDIFRLFDSRDFVLWEIFTLGRRPLDRALAWLDAVFVPASSPLRADKRWSATA